MGVIRSRNMSMVPILQSVSQIKALFNGEKWGILMDNCSAMIFLGAGPAALDTHKFISDLLGSMTIDTDSDSKRGLQVDASYQKMGAPLMTPQQVKRMARKYCIIFMEEERPIYDRKALPWEGNANFDEAMRLNRESPDGGYIHEVRVFTVGSGSTPDAAITVRAGKTAVIDEKSLPAGATVKVMSDADMAALPLDMNPLEKAMLQLRRVKQNDNNKARRAVRTYTLPSDRDVTGDFYASLERYLPDLSTTERAVIVEKIGEGWSEERLKGLLKMTADEMKRTVSQEISPAAE